MILSDVDIKKHLQAGKIKITPQPNFSVALGPSSLDLRLGNLFRVFDQKMTAVIDPFKKSKEITTEVKIPEGKTFILHPQEFVLAITKEKIELPGNLSGRLEGRSSLGRLGIVVHSTAGSICAGFRGHLTLELANMGKIPVVLYPGMRICAVVFEKLSTPSERPYYLRKDAKYLDQKEPNESKLINEKDEV